MALRSMRAAVGKYQDCASTKSPSDQRLGKWARTTYLRFIGAMLIPVKLYRGM